MIEGIPITVYVQLLAGLLPIAYLIFSKKNFQISFFIFLTLSFITTFVIIVTGKLGIHNHWVINFYNFTSFLCLMYYFYQIQSTKINYPLIFSVLFILIFLIEYFISKSSIFLFFSSFFIIICCLLFFINETKKENRRVEFRAVSIVNASLLFYFSFSFIFLSLLWKLINYQIWEIHNIIESTSKLIITYAFWKLPKTSQ